MPIFNFRAVAEDGSVSSGFEERESVSAVEALLEDRGLLPLEIRLTTRSKEKERRSVFRGRRAEVTRSFRFLATLLEADLPLDRALEIAIGAARHGRLTEALSAVRNRVRQGMSVADAVAHESDFFPRIAVGMTRAGERGGHLQDAFERLASHLEREQRLRARLQTALFYPVVMIAVGCVSLFVLLTYVLPRFTTMLTEAGIALPLTTQLLLETSELLAGWWWPLLLLMIGVGTALARYIRSDRGRSLFHAALLRIPVIRPLRRRLASAHLGRSLAVLLDSGVPAVEAFDVAADGLADRVAARELREAKERLRSGERMAEALWTSSALAPVFVQMVEVGEEGGRLSELLERAAEAMERELEQGLERLVRLAEPLLIVVFGAVVGFVAVALLQAIYGVHSGGFAG